jgi:Zn-dependent protease with chaperone function
MGLRKWLMKQYWRLVQARSIWNLFYGILLLAITYYLFFPFFANMQLGPFTIGEVTLGPFLIGPFALAGVLLFSFIIIGYIYDKVLVMWSPQQEVMRERDPFQYVAQPRDRIFWFPIYSVLLSSSEDLLTKLNLDTVKVNDVREYFAKLETFRPERPEDIEAAKALRKKFVEEHPFSDFLSE